jgi:hypothetical protein
MQQQHNIYLFTKTIPQTKTMQPLSNSNRNSNRNRVSFDTSINFKDEENKTQRRSLKAKEKKVNRA